ncbi:hypothetical protein [Rossellomorea sp. LjRoot5]|uniref:hypothetical protein n=1 Tax=Rossellomorea sp. LjRoot5 TaxID=3342331 RepID=UPI003ECD9A5E
MSDVKDLLIYRNRYSNFICSNPRESDYRKVSCLSAKEAAKLVGFKWYALRKQKFQDLLLNTEIDGKPVFILVNDGEKIAVNPNVREPLEYSPVLAALFNGN